MFIEMQVLHDYRPKAGIQLIGFYPHLKLAEGQKQDLITKDLFSYYQCN